MATVYKAYDTRLESEVAVKVIRTEELPPNVLDRALKRFEREAKALARLAHPNIIPIIDYGEYESRPYLVMKYIPGGTLKERLKFGALPWQEAMRLLLPIARALDYAHRQDMIHRDVKPSNILITADGEPMLTDFGVAKIIDAEATVDLTGTSMAVGTPEYMAPEQFQGGISESVDIYALGVVLYEMLTGRKPYSADTPAALIIKQATDPLPRPSLYAPNLPGGVEKLLLKALAKKPQDRYQKMAELTAVMADVSSKGVSTKREARSVNRLPTVKTGIGQGGSSSLQRSQRRPWLLGVGLIGLVVISALFGWLAGSAPIGFISPKTVTSTFTQTPADASSWRPDLSYLSTSTPTFSVGSIWERPKDGMSMLYIPDGEFIMGSDDGDGDEQPVHSVYLDAFWIDKTEITNAMYAQCVSAGACDPPEYDGNYSNSQYNDHPVVWVSWDDAVAYCKWSGVRLPTEAEWEKAARGGLEGMMYPWGDESPSCQQNAENGAQYSTCGGQTMPVGSFSQNGYGLYDMAGNVWEWVTDWYDSGYYTNSSSSNPTGPVSGEFRVLRGGAWGHFDINIRSANRDGDSSTSTSSYVGFRCVRSSP